MVRQRMVAFSMAMVLGATAGGTAEAGWGSLGSYGSYGSSGGSHGSSGGAYGSSGGKYYSSYSSYSSYGSSGGSNGSSGGYSSYYGSSGGSSGNASARREGLLRRLISRIGSRHSAKSSYGSSGGYSSHGSSGGSSGGYSSYYGSSHGSSGGYSYYRSSHGSSGGSSGGYGHSRYYSHGSSGGSSGGSSYYQGQGVPVYQSAPVYDAPAGGAEPYTPVPLDEAAPAEGGNDDGQIEARVDGDTAVLTVSVPENARVFVNDKPTTSTGEVRRYMSHGLREGYSYTYVVRVESEVDGETVTDEKRVRMRAGATERLVFDLPEADQQVAANEQPEATETALTVVVPEDAKVTLAGNPTTVEGNVRTYRTSRLAPGQAWQDYTVRVSVRRGDRELTKEQTITLTGGAQEKLTFDFDEVELASR